MQPTTLDDLVARFAEAARKHHELTLAGKSRLVNEQANAMQEAFLGIIKHGLSGRNALLSLTSSEESSVALFAAVFSLKHDVARCKRVLTKLSSEPGVIGLGARQALKRWEEGKWQIE